MPGIVGFLPDYQLNNFSHASFDEVIGKHVFDANQPMQLFVKSVADGIGVATYTSSEVQVLIFGEIYSISGFKELPNNTAELFAEQYIGGNLSRFLCNINGYYTAVLIDNHSNKVVLVSDRYGLKPLYLWSEDDTLFGFASELKSLLLHDKHEVKLNREAVETFVDIGHMLGEQTQFNDVYRLLPATIIEVSLATGQYTSSRYWHWSEIAQNTHVSERDAIEQAFKLFDQSIRRQVGIIKDKQLAITLSGGLDSRVLLAAAKHHFDGEIVSYTFGSKGCDDAVLAEQVAEKASVDNYFTEVNAENWFTGREQGVWYTDGLKNILHMHALSSADKISKRSHYLLNGFLGDVTFGGSYLLSEQVKANTLADRAEAKYGRHAKAANSEDAYFSENIPDSLFIYNRGVRFIGAGSDLLGSKLQNIKPFFDNELMDYLYGLPEAYRRDGKLYHKMLLAHYPDYFATIPWQQTGKPITGEGEVNELPNASLKSKVINAIKGSPFDGFLRALYRRIVKSNHYVSYDAWLREPDFRTYLENLVLPEDSICKRVLSKSYVENIIKQFYKGNPHYRPEIVGSLITLELFCRQLAGKGKNITVED